MPAPAVNGQQQTNGSTNTQSNSDEFSQILRAIQAIHQPQSSNDTRKAATEYLENVKQSPNAPQLGFSLAIDTRVDMMLRHFGLQLLEHYIKYVWDGESGAEAALRDYIMQLAQSLREEDPGFIRNKVAQLWVEVAKRSWGVDWMDMDQLLTLCWEASSVQKTFVLHVLETLSEEVFAKEDATAGMRGNELHDALVEIFTPASVLPERSATRHENAPVLRHGTAGWLQRFVDLLSSVLAQGTTTQDAQIRLVAERTLKTIKSCLLWTAPGTLVATRTVMCLYAFITYEDEEIKLAAIDAMNTVLHLSYEDDEFTSLICPLFSSSNVDVLVRAVRWAKVDPSDIDEGKYNFLKKTSEVIAQLGRWLEHKPRVIVAHCANVDLPAFFSLTWSLTTHESLMVSINLVSVWNLVLRSETLRSLDFVAPYIPQLLEHCTARSVRYECLPEGINEPVFLFLDDDLDTLPEKHAFIGNYRRYCADIVEVIVRQHSVEAVTYILQQSRDILTSLAPQTARDAAAFRKNSTASIMIESRLKVVDAAVRGYVKWTKTEEGTVTPGKDQKKLEMQTIFKQWCDMAFGLDYKDPEILAKLIPVVVTICAKALSHMPEFAIDVAGRLMNLDLRDDPAHPDFSDGVRNLQHVCTLELQRLAFHFPNAFLDIYSALQETIERNVQAGRIGLRPQMGYQAFLLIVVQRASRLDEEQRKQKMREMLEPIRLQWLDAEVVHAATDFQAFCKYIGLEPLPDYVNKHRFQSIEDWSSRTLDQEGMQLQRNVSERNERLPIRITRAMLAATTEGVHPGTPIFETTQAVWTEIIPSILEPLLGLISQAQGFSDMSKWAGLPEELQGVMKRILADRFWQVGISTESKDAFFGKVGNKTTYDGLASAVRGSPRQVRDTAYSVLESMSRFRDYFYAMPELPQALSQALFANSHSLSPHHYNTLLAAAGILVSRCPAHLRAGFIPTFLSSLYQHLHLKLSAEWDAANSRREQATSDDNLGDEMKVESTLRQLTYAACNLTTNLLDATKADLGIDPRDDHPDARMHKFITARLEILEPILVFMKAALLFRDHRAAGHIIRLLRGLIPQFKDPGPVHDFLSGEILQTAIVALHTPYFYDIQRDLATLIAHLVQVDPAKAKAVILQLPGYDAPAKLERVDKCIRHIAMERTTEKKAKAYVLELLKDVRGVGIAELGKIERAPVKKVRRVEEGMAVDEGARILRGGSPGLEGLSGMFE